MLRRFSIFYFIVLFVRTQRYFDLINKEYPLYTTLEGKQGLYLRGQDNMIVNGLSDTMPYRYCMIRYNNDLKNAKMYFRFIAGIKYEDPGNPGKFRFDRVACLFGGMWERLSNKPSCTFNYTVNFVQLYNDKRNPIDHFESLAYAIDCIPTNDTNYYFTQEITILSIPTLYIDYFGTYHPGGLDPKLLYNMVLRCIASHIYAKEVLWKYNDKYDNIIEGYILKVGWCITTMHVLKINCEALSTDRAISSRTVKIAYQDQQTFTIETSLEQLYSDRFNLTFYFSRPNNSNFDAGVYVSCYVLLPFQTVGLYNVYTVLYSEDRNQVKYTIAESKSPTSGAKIPYFVLDNFPDKLYGIQCEKRRFDNELEIIYTTFKFTVFAQYKTALLNYNRSTDVVDMAMEEEFIFCNSVYYTQNNIDVDIQTNVLEVSYLDPPLSQYTFDDTRKKYIVKHGDQIDLGFIKAIKLWIPSNENNSIIAYCSGARNKYTSPIILRIIKMNKPTVRMYGLNPAFDQLPKYTFHGDEFRCLGEYVLALSLYCERCRLDQQQTIEKYGDFNYTLKFNKVVNLEYTSVYKCVGSSKYFPTITIEFKVHYIPVFYRFVALWIPFFEKGDNLQCLKAFYQDTITEPFLSNYPSMTLASGKDGIVKQSREINPWTLTLTDEPVEVCCAEYISSSSTYQCQGPVKIKVEPQGYMNFSFCPEVEMGTVEMNTKIFCVGCGYINPGVVLNVSSFQDTIGICRKPEAKEKVELKAFFATVMLKIEAIYSNLVSYVGPKDYIVLGDDLASVDSSSRYSVSCIVGNKSSSYRVITGGDCSRLQFVPVKKTLFEVGEFIGCQSIYMSCNLKMRFNFEIRNIMTHTMLAKINNTQYIEIINKYIGDQIEISCAESSQDAFVVIRQIFRIESKPFDLNCIGILPIMYPFDRIICFANAFPRHTVMMHQISGMNELIMEESFLIVSRFQMTGPYEVLVEASNYRGIELKILNFTVLNSNYRHEKANVLFYMYTAFIILLYLFCLLPISLMLIFEENTWFIHTPKIIYSEEYVKKNCIYLFPDKPYDDSLNYKTHDISFLKNINKGKVKFSTIKKKSNLRININS